MKKIQQKIIDLGVKQLESFVVFQNEEYNGMTIRDFDVWLGGYVSGISHLYNKTAKPSSVEVFKNDLQQIASAIADCKIAKDLGVTGTEKEQITLFRI